MSADGGSGGGAVAAAVEAAATLLRPLLPGLPLQRLSPDRSKAVADEQAQVAAAAAALEAGTAGMPTTPQPAAAPTQPGLHSPPPSASPPGSSVAGSTAGSAAAAALAASDSLYLGNELIEAVEAATAAEAAAAAAAAAAAQPAAAAQHAAAARQAAAPAATAQQAAVPPAAAGAAAASPVVAASKPPLEGSVAVRLFAEDGNDGGKPPGSGGSGGRSHAAAFGVAGAAAGGGKPPGGSAAAGGKWSGRRKVTVAALLLLVVAAAVGTGVGVSQATKSSSSSSSDGSANVSGEPAEQPQALSPPSPPPPAPVVLLSPSPFVSPSPPPPSPLLAASPPPVLSPPPPVNSPPPPPPVNSPPPPPVLSPPVVSPPPPPPPGTSPPPPPAATPPPAAPGPAWLPAGGVALLEDGFSGNSLDAFVWDYETDPPVQGRDANQLQTYTSSLDNIAVVDDILYIKAQKLPDGTYTSGRLNSRPNGGWYPGGALPDGRTAASVHVEASIQVPTAGQGLWPQFWLAPLEDAYGAWPASGEIDVMQARNNMSSVTQAIQFGSPWPANSKAEVTTADVAPFLGDFHTYAVDWTVDTIIMYVDGRETARFVPRATDPANGWYSAGNAATQAPFDKPFSVVLNLAVGGTWPGPPDGTTPFPAQMAVQYVHAWAVPQ